MIKDCFFYVDETGKIKNPGVVKKAFHLPAGAYHLTIEKKSKRSNDQNKYYWVIVNLCRDAFIELGNEVSLKQVHEFFKGRFNYKEIVNKQTGEVVEFPNATTELSKDQFSEYIERIKQFAAEFLNINIPDAGEQTKFL